MAFGVDPKVVEQVTKAVRKVTDKPVIVKLSPNVTDIVEIAKAVEAGGGNGVSLINTILGMAIDIHVDNLYWVIFMVVYLVQLLNR